MKETTIPKSDVEAKIENVRHKSSCEYLKQQIEMQEVMTRDLHNRVSRAEINEIKNSQHWNTIRMLFGGKEESQVSVAKAMIEKEVQVEVFKKDSLTIIDEVPADKQPTMSLPIEEPTVKHGEESPNIDRKPLQSEIADACVVSFCTSHRN